MEELKIIDENHILFDGVKYKAVESGLLCDGCVFLKSEKNCQFNRDEKKFMCVGYSRKDLRSVIWVNEEYTPEPYDEAIARAKEEIKKCLPENEKKLPKTWEDYCKLPIHNKTFYYISQNYARVAIEKCDKAYANELDFNKKLIPSKELAEAMLALCQLLQLRECYNEGWKPDWKDNECKYCILVHKKK